MASKFICTQLSKEVEDAGLSVISTALDNQEKGFIDKAPWGIDGQKPDVQFAMAYNAGNIYLKYNISEPHLRAEVKEINGPVYEDSCVEFFIAFGDDEAYYNFEFNSLGVFLVGFGPGKERVHLPVEAVEKVKVLAKAQPQGEQTGLYNWSLVIQLPFEVFIHHQIKSLQGQTCRVNFYKCGDLLPNPHFLTWAPIEHPFPEFHLPQFFGELVFA